MQEHGQLQYKSVQQQQKIIVWIVGFESAYHKKEIMCLKNSSCCKNEHL